MQEKFPRPRENMVRYVLTPEHRTTHQQQFSFQARLPNILAFSPSSLPSRATKKNQTHVDKKRERHATSYPRRIRPTTQQRPLALQPNPKPIPNHPSKTPTLSYLPHPSRCRVVLLPVRDDLRLFFHPKRIILLMLLLVVVGRWADGVERCPAAPPPPNTAAAARAAAVPGLLSSAHNLPLQVVVVLVVLPTGRFLRRNHPRLSHEKTAAGLRTGACCC